MSDTEQTSPAPKEQITKEVLGITFISKDNGATWAPDEKSAVVTEIGTRTLRKLETDKPVMAIFEGTQSEIKKQVDQETGEVNDVVRVKALLKDPFTEDLYFIFAGAELRRALADLDAPQLLEITKHEAEQMVGKPGTYAPHTVKLLNAN